MPPARRKTPAQTGAGNTRAQKTLAFGPQNTANKITKPTAASAAKSSKKATSTTVDSKAKPNYQKPDVASISPSPEAEAQPEPIAPPPTTRSPGRTRRSAPLSSPPPFAEPQGNTKASTNSYRPLTIRRQGQQQQEAAPAPAPAQAPWGDTDPKTQAALKIADAQIKRYWQSKENSRIAPRVHQKGLTVNEKVLREFDSSSQFGPCIGITRLKRWKRADGLGLRPPLEVLAVLVKEEGKGNNKVERAYMEGLLSSRMAVDE